MDLSFRYEFKPSLNSHQYRCGTHGTAEKFGVVDQIVRLGLR